MKIKAIVNGFKFIGHGKGKAKKQAQTNAALDFLDHLVRSDKIDKIDVPLNVMKALETKIEKLIHFKIHSNYINMIQLINQILECKQNDQETDSEAHISKSSQARPSTSNQKIESTTSKRTATNSQSDSASIASSSFSDKSSN